MCLSVTAGRIIPPNFWIWTFLTHSLIERHIWNLIVDIAVIFLCGKLLEPLWGALEMLIFYNVVTIGVAINTTFFYMFIYLITKNETYLFGTHIHGMAGYLAGFAVASKQVMPDHVLVNSPFGKLRNKHVPMLLFYTFIPIRLLGGVDGPFPIMFGFGIIVSWIYLRFYQKHSNGNRGDYAESFSFASFFPTALQPVVSVISNSVFNVFVKLRICKKPQRKYDVSNPTTITVTLPGNDPDAERRRQVALKALNERLNKSEQPSDAPSWPAMDDEGTEESGSVPNDSSPTSKVEGKENTSSS
ncbi:DgyrCDS4661 [Dimorphilus gyrociliatus]|uniref:DgyrCDS4661 n=1 Tax=Dimorphilus gyrociliatus TaxID=2664684 RepID=A0A7I8VHA7_9ANNE|nr:DgyrCDS4661 [Dimorphilus gyrociliatus]